MQTVNKNTDTEREKLLREVCSLANKNQWKNVENAYNNNKNKQEEK